MAYVLIVDDDEADRLLMQAILDEAGHETFVEVSGEDALKLYLRRPIEVVVTDLQMANGDGYELIESLCGLDPEAAIVTVSGEGAEKLEIAREAGALEALEKPIEREALIAAVTRALKRAPAPPAA